MVITQKVAGPGLKPGLHIRMEEETHPERFGNRNKIVRRRTGVKERQQRKRDNFKRAKQCPDKKGSN